MTIGLGLSNGLEAVALTDARVSHNLRHSDSVEKMHIVTGEKTPYAGAVFGRGHLENVASVLADAATMTADNAEQFVVQLQSNYQHRTLEMQRREVLAQLRDATTESLTLEDTDEQRQFISDTMRKYINHGGPNVVGKTQLVAIMHDAQKNIRFFHFNHRSYEQRAPTRIEIGQGADAAEKYFAIKLQGIRLRNLSLSDLTFFAINAGNVAQLYDSVGGVPTVAHIGAKGNKSSAALLPIEKVVALTNISGAYLAECSRELDLMKARDIFRDIITAKKPRYAHYAALIDMSAGALQHTYVPFSSWQMQANRNTFS